MPGPGVVGVGVRVTQESPTLEVVERLLDAADAELSVKPIVEFDYREDPEIGSFFVFDRLWSVPLPD